MIQLFEYYHGIQNDKVWHVQHHRPYKVARDNFLSDFAPKAWQSGDKDLETIFNNYYDDERDTWIESATFQANTKITALNIWHDYDGLHHQTGSIPEIIYWSNFYSQLQNEQ